MDNFNYARDILCDRLLLSMQENFASYVEGFSHTNPIVYHDMQSYLRSRFMSYSKTVAASVLGKVPQPDQITAVRAGMNAALTKFLPKLVYALRQNGITVEGVPMSLLENEKLPVINFEQDDAVKAWENWGCNCGPVALAAVTGYTLDEIRPHLSKFETRMKVNRYMSPTDMANSIDEMQWVKDDHRGDEQTRVPDAFPILGLVRVQWCGPWTEPGQNPRWAYGHTHWIGTFIPGGRHLVFDVNCGLVDYKTWSAEIVPMLIPKRGNGRWFPSHLWPMIDRNEQVLFPIAGKDG